jgi:mannosyltransferase
MGWEAFGHLLSTREINMVLYYVFLRGWLQFGDSEIYLRLPSVMFGTVAIVATCIFASRIRSQSVALMAGVFLSFHVLALRYTQQARSYALVMMLVAFSWICYERAVRRTGHRDLILWMIVSALATYAHLFAGLVMVSQLACLLFAHLDRERLRGFFRAVGGFLILISPLIVIVLRMEEDPLSWVHPLGRDTFMMFGTDFFNGGQAQIVFALILLLSSVFALIRAPREQRWAISTAVFGALIPIALVVLVSIFKPALIARYMIVALPSYAIAIAIGLELLPRKLATAGAIAVLLLGIPLLREYEREPAWNNFRDTVAYIAQRAQPGDAIIIWEPLARPAVEYYASRRKIGQQFPEIVFPGSKNPLTVEDIIAIPEPRDIDASCDRYRRIWILYNVDFPPERYYIWHTFFARRAAIHHRLISRISIPGRIGAQVLEYERP